MEIKEITDKNIWEKFLSDTSPQSFFQSWNWGEVIGKKQKAKIKNQILWRLGLIDGNNIVGIAQVHKSLAKKGNFLHVRHGPIFSSLNRQYISFFNSFLKELSKKEKAGFLRISPLLENSVENKSLFESFNFHNAPIHAMDGEYCWIVDLSKSEDELLSGMRKTTRYLVRQAQKMGVKIVKSKSIHDIEAFLKLYKLTAQRHQFVEHKSIREEFEQLLEDDQILLFMGYYQDQLISAALIVFYNNQAIYHHSASIEQKIPVNYLLQWEIIKEAKIRGKTVYNMWGIAPEGRNHHPWKGLTVFKKGFGGRVLEYLHAQDIPYSFSYCTTYLLETARRIWKGY